MEPPHGPACHCGRSRLSTNFPNSLPSHLYPQPSVIPTFKARLVIVAGPASSVSPRLFLSITPIFLFIWLPSPQEGGSGGTCHNDKPGRNDGYGGSRYDYGGSEEGSRWKGETCNSSKPCHVSKWRGDDGEEVRRDLPQ